MFDSIININDNYFYMPFGPVVLDHKDLGLVRLGLTDIYVNKKNGQKWKKRLLYNTGWGRPYGFERMPELNFNDLLKLALQSDYKSTKLSVKDEESNKYGAISIIMEEHPEEFINFLYANLENEDLYNNPIYRDNLKLFGLDDKFSNGNGGDANSTYEDVLNTYPKWKEIAIRVKQLVYRE